MITAAVLTHNSQRCIKKVLKSVSFCDEVIIVDDESSDRTVDIAKQSGAKICKRALNGDFSAQRNFVLSHAKGDWVLFIDSDEMVTDALRDEIISVTSDIAGLYNGFMVRRRDFFGGRELRYGETSSVWLLRLARSNKGTWIRPVHEVWSVRGNVGRLTHSLLHAPHNTVSQFLDKINLYSTLQAKHLFDDGVREPVWYIWAYPVGKFIKNYLLLFGFLDGVPGFIMAAMMSFHSFLTRSKLYLLHRKRTAQPADV